MNCTKCNAWVPDDSAFCPECGQKIEAPAPAAPEAPEAQVFCANCGAAMAATDSFCENCGAKAEVAPAEAAPVSAGSIVDKVKSLTAKVPAKYLKIGVAAVAVILVVAIIAGLFGGTKVYNYTLYIKDGEVQYAEMPKGKDVIEVTSKFAEDASDYELSYVGYYLSGYFQMSSDGKKLFYPDKVDDGYTLYYRDITNSKKEPVKLESNLDDVYQINEKGNLVTYIKDGKLYQHDLKEKTKIASDVSQFFVSDDGKTLVYMTYNDDSYTLYQKKGNKDAEKIVSDVTSLHYVSEDMSTVIYSKEDSLYTQKVGKDAEKIASDVDRVIHVYESGEVYYTTAEDAEITYWDLMKDDYEDKDDWNYKDYAEWMKDSTLDISFTTLCYYNGKESATVCESMIDYNSVANDEPVIVYSALESAELPSWSLTKYINGEVDLWDELDEYMEESSLYYVAAEATATELTLEDVYSMTLTGDGKTLYARADYDSEDEVVTLYQITLNGAKIKSTEKMDEDVYAYRLSVLGGEKKDHVIYFKDVDDEEGELYMDGTKIDDDVYLYYVSYNVEEDCLYYMVDWDDDDGLGTLKYSNGKKATAVKDDVHTYVFTPEGQCLFLYDYSDSSYRGELWIQNGKKIEKLADDVAAIIPVY